MPIPLLEPDGRETLLRDEAGRVVMTKFSETTLRQIASATGGRYVRSTTGNELQDAIADIVRASARIRRLAHDDRIPRPVPGGVWRAAGVAGAVLWLLL